MPGSALAARVALLVVAVAGIAPLAGCQKDAEESRSVLPYHAARVPSADLEQAVAGLNTLGSKVWAALGDEGANSFFSPVSVTVPLAALYGGSRGQTGAELGAALYGSAPPDLFHSAVNQLRATLVGRALPPASLEGRQVKLDLVLASSVWVQTGYAVEPSFLDLLASDYDMRLRSAGFEEAPSEAASSINAWVSDSTAGKLQRLLDPQSLPAQTRFVLASTLYLDASWAAPFDPARTTPHPFQALAGERTVAMMRQSGAFRAADLDGASVLELPYVGRKLALLIVLPEPGPWVSAREKLAAWLEGAPRALHEEAVDVQLPRFSFSWGPRSLVGALKAAGIRRAFEPGADFSGIVAEPKLVLDDVVQSTVFSVTESGTVAAAASAGSAAVARAPVRSFLADRPFFVAVRDEMGALAFIGQVVAPGQE